RLPVPLATCEYLALGWGALLCYYQMARMLPHRAMATLITGGVFYSIGALINLINWPVLWPGVIDPHGVFHLWVMAGTTLHFWVMLTAVVPLACPPSAEVEPVANWAPGSGGASRPVFRLNLLSGRLHQG